MGELLALTIASPFILGPWIGLAVLYRSFKNLDFLFNWFVIIFLLASAFLYYDALFISKDFTLTWVFVPVVQFVPLLFLWLAAYIKK